MASAALLRTVAQCTHPNRGCEPASLQALEAFFSDGSKGDQAYAAVLARGSARPFSPTVSARCLGLLKRFLLRSPPSPALLEQIEQFAIRTAAAAHSANNVQGIQAASDFIRRAAAHLWSQAYRERRPSSSQSVAPPSSTAITGSKQTDAHVTNINAANQDAFASADLLGSRFGSGEARGEVASHDASLLSSSELANSIRDATAAQRREAGGPNSSKLQPRNTATRPRILFSFRPYSEQDALLVSEHDILTIVDLFCEEPPNDEASKVQQGASAASSYTAWANDEAVCAAAAVKLVVEMWLQAGPTASLPLALLLLQRTYGSPHVAVRRRAFDLIVNLMVHSDMLYQLDPVLRAAHFPVSGRRVQHAGSRSSTNQPAMPAAARQRLQGFQQWLRLLLFQLLTRAVQADEVEQEVWDAALGSLMHMCCRDGQVVQEHISGLPGATMRGLLHCCRQQGWSAEVRQQLTRMTMCLLYPSPAAISSAYLAAYPDDVPSGAEAAHGWQLQPLNAAALNSLGGIAEVMRLYQHAASAEERSNAFCVLFDAAIVRLRQVNSVTDADVDYLGQLFSNLSVADALQPLFQTSQPQYMHHVAEEVCTYLDTLQRSRRALEVAQHAAAEKLAPNSMWQHLKALVRDVLSIMQSMLLEHAGIGLPPDIEKAAQETLAAVANPVPQQPLEQPEMDTSWAQLSDMFISSDPSTAANAQAWLLQLLIAASQKQQQDTPGTSAQGVNGLLPQPPDVALGCRGIAFQPQLAHLLRYVLCNNREDVDSAARFAEVVERFLVYIKLRVAQATSRAVLVAETHVVHSETSSGPGAPTLLGGLANAGTLSMTPRSGVAVQPAGGLVVTPRLDLEAPGGTVEFRPQEGGAQWQTQHPVRLLAATLSLALDWLSIPGAACRRKALVHLAEVLFSLLVAQHPADIDGSSQLGGAVPPIQSLLDGFAVVSQDALQDIDAKLVLRMLKGLDTAAIGGDTGGSVNLIHAAQARVQDVRAALVMLLLGRMTRDATEFHRVCGNIALSGFVFDSDARIRLCVCTFLLQQAADARGLEHSRSLQALLQGAQAATDEKLLSNASLQLAMLQRLDLLRLPA